MKSKPSKGNTERFRRILAVALTGIAVVAAMVFAGAPAQAEPNRSGIVTSVEEVEDQVEPLTLQACTGVLVDNNYKVTVIRIGICSIAAIGLPSPERAVFLCGVGLVATGVDGRTSTTACLAGAFG